MTLAQLKALRDRKQEADRRQDYRSALICSVLANLQRNPQKRSQPYTPDDFMLSRKKQKPDQGYLLEKMKRLTLRFGGELPEEVTHGG